MYSRAYRQIITLPPLIWVTLFLFVPYFFLFSYSLWQVRTGVIVHALTLQNYADLFRTRLYLEVLLRSARIAGSVTALSLLLGVPLAYLLSFRLRHGKDFLYQLVIVPLWISYLVRAYAWKTILGGNGVLNTLLAVTGALHHPAAWLLYSPFAVVVTLTHIYTPFVFLPVYAAFEHIPKPLVEAAQDLGASRFRTFWTVLFPLALPGIIAGATFAFVLSLGDFIAPLLIGGPNGIMISNVVVSLFGAAFNWPLGAAISVMMLLFVVVLITGAERLEARARYGAAS